MQLHLHNILKFFGVASVALLLVAASSTGFAANNIVSFTDLSGYVTVTTADGDVKRLKKGDTLNEGDVINTGDDSSVTVTLDSGEVVTLGGNDTFRVPSPRQSAGSSFAQRSSGTKLPTLSSPTSAGGGASTTPGAGGSPTN